MVQTAFTRAPAKLNLFLELLAKRPDGYHELETVMVPINWFDSLLLTRTARPGIELSLRWLPSRTVLAKRLNVWGKTDAEAALLEIPTDHRNLVCKALSGFLEVMQLEGGFDCELLKQIPAGAGMGGASGNAASALIAAAELCGVHVADPKMKKLAADLGSDVPFFVGQQTCDNPKDTGNSGLRAARGFGRGERIEACEVGHRLNVVVVFPGRMLSTPLVYRHSTVPSHPNSAQELLDSLSGKSGLGMVRGGFNRLSEPAMKIEPKVDETLQLMRQQGLKGCQMTGSGAACYGFAFSARHARRIRSKLASQLQPGAFIRDCRIIRVPSIIVLR
jgi:4-diphosphocytidyl-2-C-methyl-D-erythritol kinase